MQLRSRVYGAGAQDALVAGSPWCFEGLAFLACGVDLSGKPRTARMESKQGNKASESCLVVVSDALEGVWPLVPLAPNL